MSRVSVIVPTHNAERYLHQTLASIAHQTTPPHEVIVVDDASTDRSYEVATSFGASSPCPVRIIRNSESEGVARARNRGVLHATGSWVALCDNDDLWHPALLNDVLDRATEEPHLQAVAVGHLGFAHAEDRQALAGHQRSRMVDAWVTGNDPLGELVPLVDAESRTNEPPTDVVDVTFADLQIDTCFATTQIVFRRDEYITSGGCATWCHRADDWVLNGSVASVRSIPKLRKPRVFYRVRASSQSHHQSQSALALLTASTALRLGGKTVDRRPAEGIYRHLVLELLRRGELRLGLGFGLLGDFPTRDLARMTASAERTHGPTRTRLRRRSQA